MAGKKNIRTPIFPDSYIPHVPGSDGEYFVNGIFYFNITQMIDDIENDRCPYSAALINIPLWRSRSLECKMVDEHIEAADITRPIIIAEISPDKIDFIQQIDPDDWQLRGYNLLDEHHRVEKAIRHGIEYLKACVLPMETHIRYMYKGLPQYTEYWNGKMKDLKEYQC